MTASRALIGVALMGALSVAALGILVVARGLSGPTLAGLGIGAGLGGANLALGGWLLSWTLRRKPSAALAVSLGGFFFRLGILLVLTYVFWGNPGVDAVTFAVSFVVFFFLFLVVEIAIVSRAARRPDGAGASE
jgi:hypothetical protein